MSFLTKELIYQRSSQELTLLLYEAGERNIEEAISAIHHKDFGEANEKFQKAIDIVERLGVGLNYEAGIIADELDSLYNYINDILFKANFEKNASLAKEALTILKELASAWNEAIRSQKDSMSTRKASHLNAYEKNTAYGD